MPNAIYYIVINTYKPRITDIILRKKLKGKGAVLIDENERAAYGKQLLQYISAKLTSEFGNGFSVTNLKYMRQFYLAFPIRHTVCGELSWSHYRHLMRVTDTNAREFYLSEAIKANWSVRQLERQINTLYYNRILASRNKESVESEIQKTEPKSEYEKIIKDP